MVSKKKKDAVENKISDLRVFLIESPNPADLLLNRSEIYSLSKICELYGYRFSPFLIKSENEFKDTIAYLSSYDIDHDNCNKVKTVLSLHLSMHGNSSSIAMGKDSVSWSEIAKDLKPLFTLNFPLPIIIVLSCCYSGKQKITTEINRMVSTEFDDELIKPPAYIFVNNTNEIEWADAVLAWTIFYRQIVKCDLKDKQSIQRLINGIAASKYASLKYFRWDEPEQKYLTYTKGDT